MTDSVSVVMRLVMFVFAPAMLLAPVLFVLLMPIRVATSADPQRMRAEVRGRLVVLSLATLVALAVWLGMLLAGVNLRSDGLRMAAQFTWILFFPLWFVFALPVLRAKQPAMWEGHGVQGQVRAASLVNRARCNPIGTGHWVVFWGVLLLLTAVVALRGWMRSFATDAQQLRWMILTGCTIVTFLVLAPVMAWGIRLTLREPEPMDAAGSPALARMYDEYRSTKIRAMFWTLGVAMPVMLGTCMACMVWWDGESWIGWIGAGGGVGFGLVGAWMGLVMSMRRARIAEFKRQLDVGQG